MNSCPQELDEITRHVRRLEIEEIALKKEHDDISMQRLKELQSELVELKAKADKMTAQWQREKRAIDDVKKVRIELENSRLEFESSLNRGDNETAARLKYGKIPELEKKLKAHEELQRNNAAAALLKEEVSSEEIAEVVSRWSSIPIRKLVEGEREKLLKLSEKLHRRVIGQDEAVDALADAVLRSRSGIKSRNRPVGAFLFLGPTGVGKTELAKALAEELFDDENAMLRLDMSEYMEKFAISRLVGAPPGYVGFEDGGELTEAVRRKPYSVILLDEIEKAHPDVFNLLLQVMDDGRLTDSHGRTVNFKNAILIMTSNARSEELKDLFRPEFLNRLDDTLKFSSLDKAQIAKIVELQIENLRQRLREEGLDLKVDDAAISVLSDIGYDKEFGARPVKRAIQRELETPIARRIIEGKYVKNPIIKVSADGNGIVIRDY